VIDELTNRISCLVNNYNSGNFFKINLKNSDTGRNCSKMCTYIVLLLLVSGYSTVYVLYKMKNNEIFERKRFYLVIRESLRYISCGNVSEKRQRQPICENTRAISKAFVTSWTRKIAVKEPFYLCCKAIKIQVTELINSVN